MDSSDQPYQKGNTPFSVLANSAQRSANQIFGKIGISFPAFTSAGTQKVSSKGLQGVPDGAFLAGSHLFFVRWKADSNDLKLDMTETTQVSRSYESKPGEPVPNPNPMVIDGVNAALTQGSWKLEDGSEISCADLIWADSPTIATFTQAVSDRPAHDTTLVVRQTLTVKEASSGKVLKTLRLKITVDVKQTGTVTGNVITE